jgi:hypothetical protein
VFQWERRGLEEEEENPPVISSRISQAEKSAQAKFENRNHAGLYGRSSEISVTNSFSHYSQSRILPLNFENSTFRVFTAMKIPYVVFLFATPCSIVIGYERFGGPCCLHLQGEIKREATRSSEILVSGPEDHDSKFWKIVDSKRAESLVGEADLHCDK